jgi:hypothetical protein
LDEQVVEENATEIPTAIERGTGQEEATPEEA